MLSRDVAACSDFIASTYTLPRRTRVADNNKGCRSFSTLGVGNEIIVEKGAVRELAVVLVLRNFILTLLAAMCGMS